MKINLTFLAYAILFSLIISLSIAIQAFSSESSVQQKIAGELIRFHVHANSDSLQDQELKYQVKNAVLTQMRPKLYNGSNINESRNIIYKSLKEIQKNAQNIISSYGKDYKADVSLTFVYFPRISYGYMTLPPGYYEAVQITIGEGTGQNWWCVMFPMLCFVEGIAAPSTELEDLLYEVLTEEEYQEIFNVRFRTADWLLDN